MNQKELTKTYTTISKIEKNTFGLYGLYKNISALWGLNPANAKHLYNICTTSAQRLRRWFNIVQKNNVIQIFCVCWECSLWGGADEGVGCRQQALAGLFAGHLSHRDHPRPSLKVPGSDPSHISPGFDCPRNETRIIWRAIRLRVITRLFSM